MNGIFSNPEWSLKIINNNHVELFSCSGRKVYKKKNILDVSGLLNPKESSSPWKDLETAKRWFSQIVGFYAWTTVPIESHLYRIYIAMEQVYLVRIYNFWLCLMNIRNTVFVLARGASYQYWLVLSDGGIWDTLHPLIPPIDTFYALHSVHLGFL